MRRPGWIDWIVALTIAVGVHGAVLSLLASGSPGVPDPGADGVAVTLHQSTDAPGAGAAAPAVSVPARPPSPAREHAAAVAATTPAPDAAEAETEAGTEVAVALPPERPTAEPVVPESDRTDATTPPKPRERAAEAPEAPAEPAPATVVENATPPETRKAAASPAPPQAAQVVSLPAMASGSLDAAAMAGELGAPGGDTAAHGYLLRLREHFDERKRYPREAYVRGEQGVVGLRFVVDRSGTVLSYEIARSSGHPALDREVLSLMDRVQPLPPFPDDLSRERMALGMPIEFHLP